MNITIFGATGQIGQHLTKLSLAAGHKVTAFTRSPNKMEHIHENLQVIQGDVLGLAAVTKATIGSDAVFCALGMPLMNKVGLRAKGTKHCTRHDRHRRQPLDLPVRVRRKRQPRAITFQIQNPDRTLDLAPHHGRP